MQFIGLRELDDETLVPSPVSASWNSKGLVMSMALVTTISEMFGAEDSRLEEVPTGVLIPRPTPNWQDVNSIQPLYFPVTGPLILPYFM